MTDSGGAATEAEKHRRTTEPEQEQPEKQQPWWLRHYTFIGTAVGLVFLWFSLTPSLLPRGPLFQGLVSGAAGAIGYGLGVFVVWLVRYMRSKDTSPPAPRWAWIALVVVGIIGQILMIVWFHVWQDDVRDLMGVPRLGFWDHPLTAVLAIVTLFVFVEIGQLIGKLVRFLVRQLNRVAPPRISAVVVVVLLLALTIALLNGIVVRFAMSTLNKTFAAVNDETDPDFPAPTSTLRSGGPQSLASWESLGHQGRVFVSAGPTVDELSKFNGKPAIEPIRAYAGLHSADGIKATAALAAEELRRNGRARPRRRCRRDHHRHRLDQRGRGVDAGVHVQRQYRDRQHAVFVPAELAVLPGGQGERPAGRSGAVRGCRRDDSRNARGAAAQAGRVRRESRLVRRRGAVPGAEQSRRPHRRCVVLRAHVQQHDLDRPHPLRDKGSPEWLPIYDRGENVRFVARPDDLGRPDEPWGTPRAVYLQHASDPIAWWTPDLLFEKPDWLREPRGYDVSPRMEWIPVVTFLQVSADMAVAIDVPDGHGHVYIKNVANGWAAVLRPPGWTPEKTERLRPLLSNDD